MFSFTRFMRSSSFQTLLAAALLLVAGQSYATVQKADEVRIGDSIFTVRYSPLLYRYGNSRENWRRVIKEIGGNTGCTANYVGFVARWEVVEGSLYLVSLVLSPCGNKEPADLSQWFDLDPNGKVRAQWFTGSLVAYRERAPNKAHTYVQSYAVDSRGIAKIPFENGRLKQFPSGIQQ